MTAQRTETFHHLNQTSKEKRPKPMIALGWEASLAGKPVMPQHGDRLGFEVMIPTNAAGCQAIFPAYLQYVDWVNLGFVGLCLKLLLEEHSQPWYLRMSKRRLSEWMTIWSRKKNQGTSAWQNYRNYNRLRLGNPGVSSFNWWQPRRQCRNQHFLGTPSHRCSLLFVQICFQSKHGPSNFVGANKQIFLQHNSSKIISKPNQLVPASMIRKPLCFFEINKGQICLSLGENIADPRGST